MENASKALLIAASLLAGVMLLALAYGYWGKMSGYFTERSDANRLQQLIKYNNKFENYNNETIRGNELISIMNMIIDYNNYQSGIEGYDRIEIEIELNQLWEEDLIVYDVGESLFIVNPNNKITNKDEDGDIKKISELSARLLSEGQETYNLPWLTETKLQKLSANIEWIADDQGKTGKVLEDYQNNRKIKLKEILGRKVEEDEIENIKEVTCLYNQLTLFKRAMFECTDVLYQKDGEEIENGRVKKMIFKVLTESKDTPSGREEHIKFD